MDYESLAAKGTMLGSGAVMAFDDSFSVVSYARRMLQFFAHESCGKCIPCREGVPWLLKIVQSIEKGEATKSDFELLKNLISGIKGVTFCPLGDSAATVLLSFINKFEEEFVKLLR
jgi:NADH-quinone oxidoreductase subunit F